MLPPLHQQVSGWQRVALSACEHQSLPSMCIEVRKLYKHKMMNGHSRVSSGSKQQVKVDLDSSGDNADEEELQRISEITMEQDNSGLKTTEVVERRDDAESLNHSANSEDDDNLRVIIDEAREREKQMAQALNCGNTIPGIDDCQTFEEVAGCLHQQLSFVFEQYEAMRQREGQRFMTTAVHRQLLNEKGTLETKLKLSTDECMELKASIRDMNDQIGQLHRRLKDFDGSHHSHQRPSEHFESELRERDERIRTMQQTITRLERCSQAPNFESDGEGEGATVIQMNLFSNDLFIKSGNPFSIYANASVSSDFRGSPSPSKYFGSSKKKKVKQPSTKDLILKGINQAQVIEDLLKRQTKGTSGKQVKRDDTMHTKLDDANRCYTELVARFKILQRDNSEYQTALDDLARTNRMLEEDFCALQRQLSQYTLTMCVRE